jgi:hypothetical protein
MNTGHTNSLFDNAHTNIVDLSFSSGEYTIGVTGIVNYDRTFTDEDIDTLNSRPKAYSDFTNGATTAVGGDEVVWGVDIGYENEHCDMGYWPPGPECPRPSNTIFTFGLNPAVEGGGGCYSGMNAIGYAVNGVALYSLGDGSTYNDENVWTNLAMFMELYDLDVCLGHAANGQYHHHSISSCLTDYLNEQGNGHSQIYGWIQDGYPIYGPYQDNGVLAKPCWFARDYSSTSVTGCPSSARDCQLVDMWDYSAGTVDVADGPSLNGTVSSLSGNEISSVSGVYLEDYFYNISCSMQGAEYLDSHNGHDHGDYGYHYHFTIDTDAKPIFPYLIGPKYYGCVTSSACCGSIISFMCDGESICESPTGVAESSMNCTQGKTTDGIYYENTDSCKQDLPLAVIIGVIIGIIGICIILCCLYYYFRKRSTKSTIDQDSKFDKNILL